MEARLPICYKPSQVIFLDDDENFLQSLPAALPTEMNFATETNPKKFVNQISQAKRDNQYFKNVLQQDDDTYRSTKVAVDLFAIHEEIYQPKRFEQLTVLVVDFAMPGMDGIAVCEALKHHTFKKILLTGEAGLELAVDAFNRGVIDQFILKNDKTRNEKLIQAIHDLQKQYFLDFSATVIGALRVSAPNELTLLSDPAYYQIFHEVFVKNKIVEYYLLDIFGSYLMLDINAKATWLIVKDETEMDDLIDFASYETNVDPKLIENLKNRRQIPYFYGEQAFEAEPTVWQNYMHPALKFHSGKNYFYAILKQPKQYPLEAITSYQAFLEKL